MTPAQPSTLALIAAALLAATAISFLLTPLAIASAHRLGVIDRPDSGRRVHRLPIPRAGGFAVAVAFIVAGIAALWLGGSAIGGPATIRGSLDRDIRIIGPRELGGLFAGMGLAALIGFVDDRWQLRARWQFLGQLALAAVAVASGIFITFVANPFTFLGGAFDSDLLAFDTPFQVALTTVWIVGMINSLNFIDGLDGLSTGISLIAAITLGVISLTFTQFQPIVALLCAVLAGSLAGFLPWNFHPAKVFIGTTGVYAVGYALAVLSILGTAKVAVALLVLGVPIIDTFWIIIRRLANRQSPFTPDRGHFHHRLLDLGLTHRGAVLVIYALCVALAVLSLALSGAGQLYAFMGIVVAGGFVLYLLTRRAQEALDARSYPDQPPPRTSSDADVSDYAVSELPLDDPRRRRARPVR